MKLIRIVVIGLAILLPTSWTLAQAADEAPAGETTTPEKSKKSKKAKKKVEGSKETATDKPAE